MLFFRVPLCVLIGFLLGLSNLYVALQVGLTLGIAVHAAFLWSAVHLVGVRIRRKPTTLSDQDKICYISLATSMSYGCGTITATALTAILMDNPKDLSPIALTLWVAGLCGLGACLGAPLRQRMLDEHPFPSGKVAAATVRSLKSGADLVPFFAAVGAVWLFQLLRDRLKLIPATLPPNGLLAASPMLLGLGVLLGVPVCLAMLIGGVIFHVLLPTLAPELESGHTWPALGLIIAGSLLHFLHTAPRTALKGRIPTSNDDLPWRPAALVCLIVAASAAVFGLNAPIAAVVPVALITLLFAVLSARVTGETDLVPTGPLGKLALLTFGLTAHGDARAGLVAAGALTAPAAACADVLTDFRAGRELGCPPKRQFQYQLAGAVLGPLLMVPLFLQIPARGYALGGPQLPAPAAQIWLEVAQLHKTAGLSGAPIQLLTLGLVIGAAYYVIQQRFPAAPLPGLVPAATAAFLDLPTVFTLCTGAMIGRFIQSERTRVVCCALIAAESIGMMLDLLW